MGITLSKGQKFQGRRNNIKMCMTQLDAIGLQNVVILSHNSWKKLVCAPAIEKNDCIIDKSIVHASESLIRIKDQGRKMHHGKRQGGSQEH